MINWYVLSLFNCSLFPGKSCLFTKFHDPGYLNDIGNCANALLQMSFTFLNRQFGKNNISY